MLNKIIKTMKFLAKQRTLKLPLSNEPEFEPEARDYFVDRLKRSNLYVEYGMGGSTLVAGQLGVKFVSVESDIFYMRQVERRIKRPHRGRLIHADIGMTGEWGYPMFKKETKKRIARWRQYPETPWNTINGAIPDLILVDGRFRVATVLTCIKHLAGRKCVILMDDYLHKPSYSAVETFATITKMIGRMAELQPKSVNGIDEAIEHHSTQWL